MIARSIARRLSWLTFLGINCTWQIGGDARMLRKAAKKADVLLLVECRTRSNEPLDVAAILGPDWHVEQDTSSSARAGSVIAVRKASGITVRRAWWVELSPAGHSVQARYLCVAVLVLPNGDIVEAAAGHIPLPDTGRMDEAEQRAAEWRRHADLRAEIARRRGVRRCSLFMGDGNQEPERFARRIGAPHHFGRRPMVACRSNGWDEVRTGTGRRRRGIDHVLLFMRARCRAGGGRRG